VDRRIGDRQAGEGSVEKTTLSGPCRESKRYSLFAYFVAEVLYLLNCRGPYDNNNNTNNNNYVVYHIDFHISSRLRRINNNNNNNNTYVNKDGKEDVGDNDANDSNDDGGAPRISHASCSCDL
jgi:hypothetical protein